MYKIAVITVNEIGCMEDILNAKAEMGYRLSQLFEVTGRYIIVFEKVTQKGRPRISDPENKLGA